MKIRPARRMRGLLPVPGDKSLSHRAALLAALADGGRTRIENFATSAGCAPLIINGRHPLASISYAPPVASAQIKSCVLLAGLNADGRTAVVERTPTRDHTERLLRWFGVEVATTEEINVRAHAETEMIEAQTNTSAHIVSLAGPARLAARDCTLPGDISSAAFF